MKIFLVTSRGSGPYESDYHRLVRAKSRGEARKIYLADGNCYIDYIEEIIFDKSNVFYIY